MSPASEQTPQRIVVGVAPDQPAAVVETAVRVAERYGAELVCAWVDPARYAIDEWPDGTIISMSLDADAADEAVETADPEIAEAIARTVGDSAVPWSVRALAGAPADALARLAEELDAAMIVVGTRQPGLIGTVRELVNGSVADQLSHRQHRPVLVIPLGHDDDDSLAWDEAGIVP